MLNQEAFKQIDPAAFAVALMKLVRKIIAESPRDAALISLDIQHAGANVEQFGMLAAGAWMVALLHVGLGLPLEFPAAVRDAYRRVTSPGFTMTDCEACGYHTLSDFAYCPLCGGRCSPGAWAKWRASVGMWN